MFYEMLICIKAKKGAPPLYVGNDPKRKLVQCTLRGSILIKRHLRHVEADPSKFINPRE